MSTSHETPCIYVEYYKLQDLTWVHVTNYGEGDLVTNKTQRVYCIVTLQQVAVQPDDGRYRGRNM
jgi:hypothetical protein